MILSISVAVCRRAVFLADSNNCGGIATADRANSDVLQKRSGSFFAVGRDFGRLVRCRSSAIDACLVGDGCIGRRVKPLAAGRGSYFKMTVRVRALCIACLAHDGKLLAADDAITDIDKQAGAMAEVHEIDRIGGLVGIKLDTNIIPPLPCSVGMVGHDTRPRHTAFDGLLRAVGHLIVRHEDNVAVDAHDVHAAVPCLSAAACHAVAAIAVLDLHAAIKNAFSHRVYLIFV